ncbi:hypothetical protein GW916_06705 [bacterium]|nr:hypothetical protein [bacterium]
MKYFSTTSAFLGLVLSACTGAQLVTSPRDSIGGIDGDILEEPIDEVVDGEGTEAPEEIVTSTPEELWPTARTTTINRKNFLKQGTIQALSSGDVAVDHLVGDVIEFTSSSPVEISVQSEGLGIQGGFPVGYQINHNNDTNESEAMVFTLPEGCIGVDIHVSRLFKDEGSGERFGYLLLDENQSVVAVGSSEGLKYKKNSTHRGRLRVKGFAKYLIVYGLAMPIPKSADDSSDFLVEKIKAFFVDEL